MRITDRHIAHYRERGFAVVERFLTRDEIAQALRGFHTVMPTAAEFRAGRRPDPEQRVFPWTDGGINRIATHPELVAAAERVIGTSDIRLACCDINARYAGEEVVPWFHVDHGNNTLAPELPEDHRNITLALVLTDVEPGMSPTLVVPWGEPDSAAVPMTLPAGSLYLYSTHTTRHSASPFTAAAGLRATLWTIWARADLPFEGRAWTFKSCGDHKRQALARYIADATPRQLELIGFPPPGAPLWTPAFIAGMAKRYPGFDTAPFLGALAPAG